MRNLILAAALAATMLPLAPAAAMAKALSPQPSNTALPGMSGASAMRSSSRFISAGAISGMGRE